MNLNHNRESHVDLILKKDYILHIWKSALNINLFNVFIIFQNILFSLLCLMGEEVDRGQGKLVKLEEMQRFFLLLLPRHCLRL